MNGFANSRIRSAAADGIGHHGIDQLICRLGILAQERARRHDHSRLAISALRHVFFDPRALTGMARIWRQALNCHKTSRRSFRRGNLASAQRLSVFKDGAGTANADAATKLRSRQVELIAQDPEQRRVIIDIECMRGAVDGDPNFAHRGMVSVDLEI